MEAIRNYVDALFAALPQRGDVLRVKADMLANLEDKFSALLDEGKNEAEATGLVIASIGSAQELRSELGLDADSAEIPSEPASKTVDPALAEEYRQYQERKHVLIAVAVALFILSPFAQNLFEKLFYLEAFGNFGTTIMPSYSLWARMKTMRETEQKTQTTAWPHCFPPLRSQSPL